MELRDRRILVTGGAGFVGSHIVDSLLKMRNWVIVYDNFDGFYQGKEQNIQHNLKNKRFTLVRDDVLNYESLASAMKGVNIVFHQAAQCGVRYCIQNPRKAHEVNVTGTLNVLTAAIREGVEKMVYPSSSGIFGDLRYTPIDEDHPTNPNSPYGATKLSAEKYCLAFHEVYGLNLACLRYFSVYGPRGRPDQVIYAFTSAISNGERPTIFGDGTQTRDFTYVSDVVEATISAAECDEAGGEVFNIGFGREMSINELFRMVVEKMGGDGIRPVYKKSYRGEFPRTLADNSKAKSILRWKPRVDIDEGLDAFIHWFMGPKS